MPRLTLTSLLTLVALVLTAAACVDERESSGSVVLQNDTVSFEPDDEVVRSAADTIMNASIPGMWRPSADRIATVDYKTYFNQRYDFGFIYPASVMKPGLPIDQGRGRQFVSDDGRAVIISYVVEEADRAVLREQYQQEMNAQDTRLTYNEVHDDGYEIAGYKSGQVYHEKTLLRDGMLKIFRMLYHPDQKDFYDVIAAEASRSFTG